MVIGLVCPEDQPSAGSGVKWKGLWWPSLLMRRRMQDLQISLVQQGKEVVVVVGPGKVSQLEVFGLVS